MRNRTLYQWATVAAATLMLAACGGTSPSGALPGSAASARRHTGSSPIQHVIIIVQENRSFDNLFATFPGANGATRGKEKVKKGSVYVEKWVQLKPHSLTMAVDLQHCHAAFETDYDNGKMDGFDLEGRGACPKGAPAKKLPYQYVQPSQIAPYWDIAQQWVLADNTFQTQGSGSFTAHQDLIRGDTCIQQCSSPSAQTLSLVDNPTYWPWGCDNPNATTYTINIYGQVSQKPTGPHPCSNNFPTYQNGGYKTLADRMDAAGVMWKYYTPCFSAVDQPGCAPSNDCNNGKSPCDADLLNAFDVIYPVRNGPEWGTNVSWPDTNILLDISSGTLPQVSWVIPEDDEDDHPAERCSGKRCDNGPAWVATVVNAVGESKYWNSSVVIVLWDDWGGFYDHVVPPQFGYGSVAAGLGFRVPMMIVSPYAIAGTGSKGGYVSHTQYEFGSILKYVENNWGLPSLNTSDVRANSISDVLNYSQTPRAFTAIPSKLNAKYFINRPHVVQHGDPQ